jgi:two-component system LytT family response regulator
LLEKTTPNVVFLDVQLFGSSGFDLAPYIAPETSIIFVTAFDHYAIRAFELNALDYLLKPVHPERLALSLDRVRRTIPSDERPISGSALDNEDLLLIKDGSERRFVAVKKILAITAYGEYSQIHPEGGSVGLFRKSLTQWEADLPASHFIRVHRQAIVNTDYLSAVERIANGRYRLRLGDHRMSLETSRRLGPTLLRQLSRRRS